MQLEMKLVIWRGKWREEKGKRGKKKKCTASFFSHNLLLEN